MEPRHRAGKEGWSPSHVFTIIASFVACAVRRCCSCLLTMLATLGCTQVIAGANYTVCRAEDGKVFAWGVVPAAVLCRDHVSTDTYLAEPTPILPFASWRHVSPADAASGSATLIGITSRLRCVVVHPAGCLRCDGRGVPRMAVGGATVPCLDTRMYVVTTPIDVSVTQGPSALPLGGQCRRNVALCVGSGGH